ncbi:MAG TPA: Bax inhibitor-1/YccA family protein [Dictyobacter sp.]|jgi:modulator of FtsH protease|nr:Bax inhibitor-1/YccA family protein [Dictyobacter sp.]
MNNYNNLYNGGNGGWGGPYGQRPNRRGFGSNYQYQTLPYGMQGTQTSGLIGKVMALLAFSFIFAAIGAFVGLQLTGLPYLGVVIAGFVVLIALHFLIQKPGINLFLLYLFTFIEGMGLGPLVGAYLASGLSFILFEAFVITALTSFGLAVYSWTTKRDFSRIGDYLFVGVLLLIVASIIGIFFHSTLFALVISVVGIAIFSGYVLYYVQRAKYVADTMPNAIGLTVSLFITLLNLFLYILELLTILQGNGRRR